MNYSSRRLKKLKTTTMKFIKMFLMVTPFWVSAQRDTVTVEQAIDLAMKNNPGIRAASQNVLYHQQLKKTSSEIPKTEVSLMYGQYNSIAKDNNLSLLQSIPFPTVFSSRSALAKSQIKASEAKKAMTENELIFQIKETCYQLLYLNERSNQLLQRDSLFEGLVKSATKKLQTGEGTPLELTKAQSQQNEIRNLIIQNSADQFIYESQLQALLNHPGQLSMARIKLEPLSLPGFIDSVNAEVNPTVRFMKQQVTNAEQLKKLESARVFPELKVGFFSQTLIGVQNINGQDQYYGKDKRFTGMQAGISLPIWFVPQAAAVKAGEIAKTNAESEYQQTKINWWAQTQTAYQQATKLNASLNYYYTSGLPMAKLIQEQTLASFKYGEIGLTEFLLNMNQAMSIRETYLQTLRDYNQSIIRLEFLTNQTK